METSSTRTPDSFGSGARHSDVRQATTACPYGTTGSGTGGTVAVAWRPWNSRVV
ncbi:hypothetical protein [Streptomyces dysideae]|uniref:hypothetical protein n=1 Tax=Streptomyces dysideae TaxID=909626 RepID=UPI000B0D32C5|nr:hypothetical protein [Streptomyces dysideae]